MDKVIQWLKFDHTNKSYKHNPASVLGNDTHKLLWDFDIQTDHLISARRLHLIIINKKQNQTKGEETCCHSNSSERPSANVNMKNLQGVNYNNENNNY